MPRGIVRDVDTLSLGGDDPQDPPDPPNGSLGGDEPKSPPDPPNRRRVPRTDLLLADPRLADAERRLGRALVKAAVGRAQQRARDGLIAPEEVAAAAVAELPARAAALTPVINATGVLVHTNLGRAPLSAAAVDAIVAAAGTATWSSTSPRGRAPAEAPARSTPWPGPSPPPRRWPW